MTFDEVYSLYNSTFATKKNDDKSFYAFRKMLHELGIIDDTLYLQLAIDDSDRAQNESISYNYYYILNEGDIPSFDDFSSNNFGFKSDIIRLMSDINHVIIKDYSGNEIYYNKVINDSGLPEWEKIEDDKKIITIDFSELVSIISKYIIELQYNYKINDDYFNINVTKFDDNDVEMSDLVDMLTKWYKKIFDTEYTEDNSWSKFISYVEESGIIDSIAKSRLLSNSSAASF